jgi:acyl-CoA oxidase
MRKHDLLHHYHITEDSKDEVRRKTFSNIIIARKAYNRTYEEVDADPNSASLYGNSWVFYDLGFSVRAGVHYFLYSKAIRLLGTEKHNDLLIRAYDMKDIGCFGLTELTHGSNVKGILTEAHYDHQNQEFVMHSPSKEGIFVEIQP